MMNPSTPATMYTFAEFVQFDSHSVHVTFEVELIPVQISLSSYGGYTADTQQLYEEEGRSPPSCVLSVSLLTFIIMLCSSLWHSTLNEVGSSTVKFGPR